MLPGHFSLDVKPVASEDTVVRLGNARFTVLTSRLIRLEYDPNGEFEDRATQMIWYRQQPVPAFAVQQDQDFLTIETDAFLLGYTVGQPFTTKSLSIQVKANHMIWHPGDFDSGNLKGTTRTLDGINGYAPLSNGFISRSGWSLLDDSATFVLNENFWLEARSGSTVDWYFFAYSHDYKAVLRDYCAVSGSVPLIPRWILGNWWSRFWAYTQDELETLINDFEAHEIPLSVCIVDMDWHITETGNDCTGWTGYTWNKELFPDPQALIYFFHEKGLRTTLNLHPAEGVHPHEGQYPAMAQRMGIEPASKTPVEFDITDPTFVNAYFEILHHPYEAMGIDFWWLDWQQGLTCKIEGLDPLWLINHLHFQDLGRNSDQRPFIFSRWGNEGHQRYPIGFSGDSYMTWDTLRFQPYMTATASNVGYGWWSHDIGGHTSGDGDSELFTRWVQFGVFSPILRIHTTKGYFYDQRPWMFDNAEVRNVLRDALQLRHTLIPYLYTMAWRAHTESLPLMLPMYYEYPEEESAYHCPQQYLFGTELIVAPFTSPADPDTRLARQVVWLPEGDWYHVFTGEYYSGDAWHAIYGTLKDISVFAKAGAILPLAPKQGWGGIDNPDTLHIHAFAGADGSFTLYEDDGDSRNYLKGESCTTAITQRWASDHLDLTIAPVQGKTDLIPAVRNVEVTLHGVKATKSIAAQVDGKSVDLATSYDVATESLHIQGIQLNVSAGLCIQVQARTGEDTLLSWRCRKRETLLRMLRSFRLNVGIRNLLAEHIDAIIANPDELAPYLVPMKASHQRALCEILYEAGIHYIADTHDPVLLIMWNNCDDEAITYRYGDGYLEFGFLRSAHHDIDRVPRFKAIIPDVKTWSHGALGEHVQLTQWQLDIDYHRLATVSEHYHEETP